MYKIRNMCPAFTNFSKSILNIGKLQLPYFRTESFDLMILEIKRKLLFLVNAINHDIAILTSSGTGAIDCVYKNIISTNKKLLIINMGRFGKRLEDMAKFYNHNYKVYKPYNNFNLEKLEEYFQEYKPDYLFIQHNETSKMYLFDIHKIGQMCKKYNIIFIVDACSSFGINYIDVNCYNIDVLIFSSQKGLNIPSGLSFVMYNKALDINPKSYYFNLKIYSPENNKFIEPFTPNVYCIYQLHKMLKNITIQKFNKQIFKYEAQKEHFRKLLEKLPVHIINDGKSNCGVVFRTFRNDCEKFVKELIKKNIYISYSRGSYDELTVGHIGNLTKRDNIILYRELKKWLKS